MTSADGVEPMPLAGEQDAADADGVTHLSAPNAGGDIVALGDIDGDDCDDVAIAMRGGPDCGRVYLVYGRPRGLARHEDLLATADAVWEGCEAHVSALSDVDGDGLADLAIELREEVRLYMGRRERYSGEVPRQSGLPLMAGAIEAMAAGDVDGDGASDVWVRSSGVLQVFRGPVPRTELPLRPDTAFASILDLDALYLWDLRAVGDLDGDGRDDLALQWWATDDSTPLERTSLFYGSAQAGPPRSVLVADAQIAVPAGWPSLFHGHGDLHGDGLDDLALLASGFTNVIPGRRDRHAGDIAVDDAELTGPNVLDSDLPGAILGDIDGDGRDDFAVAPWHGGDTYDVGQDMLVAYGSPTLPTRPTRGDAAAVFRTELEYYWDFPDPVGDFDGDGFADFVLQSTSMVIGSEDYPSVMHLVYGAPR